MYPLYLIKYSILFMKGFFKKLFKIQDSVMSNQTKKFKKDNESISKLTEVVIISFYIYLWFVIFIGIHKIG